MEPVIMENNRYDVTVVGAGPAGASAAHVLASYGRKVCILDKHTFPRSKLCGGLLTIKTQRIFNDIFNISWDSVIEHVSDGVRFYHSNKLLNEVVSYKKLFFTNRELFDNLIVERAIKAGAKTYLGISIVDFDENNKIITLKDGRKIVSDFIIGADGVNSIVSKHLFKKSVDLNRIGLGLEIELERNKKYADRIYPEIYFGVLKWGYGWVFPKKDTLTVGIGGLLKYNPQMTQTFFKFLDTLFKGDFDKNAVKGHYIPYGYYKKIPGKNNILLCGDAAGLVDPITGEGIAYALQSGKYAAQAIIEASTENNSNNALEIYLKKYRTITKELGQANFLRLFLFPKISESLFAKALPMTETLPRKYIDLISGDITYGEYIRFFITKLFKGGIKHLIGFNR
jgi:geranylgeranyl reductase family protein